MQHKQWHDNDSPFIAAHEQPAVIIDLASQRGIDVNRVLKGSRLFYEDVLQGNACISINQFFHIIQNANHLIPGDDLSFRFGHLILPGNSSCYSTAFHNAPNLQAAIECLIDFSIKLTPLLRPRIILDDKYCYLHWLGAFANREQKRFAIEATYNALTSASRWLSGQRLPWYYFFSDDQPSHQEQYDVHFGSRVKFNAHIDMMRIERRHLTQAWPKSSQTSFQMAYSQGLQEYAELDWQVGFIEYLYQFLWDNAQTAPSLELVAEHLCMSPATLKRRLKSHSISFQKIFDLVRKHLSMYLFSVKGFNNEEVAEYLRFHDVNNFRRSFKRWTGLTPSEFRQA